MSDARRFYLVAPLTYTGRGDGVFTYHFDSELPTGALVTISIGARSGVGVVLEQSQKPEFATKPIKSRVGEDIIPAYLMTLASWMSAYYGASPSSVWSTILPSGAAKHRREKSANRPLVANGLPSFKLTAEQSAALDQIRSSDHAVHLLQGVTGSGKTRIYLELAAETLATGRSVIVLVPEITLTPQIIGQFEEVFGSVVISTHSKLTEAERHRVWQAASLAEREGRPSVIIGPRSCLFLPVYEPGLIVVDEEHETSYKQEQHPRYHAVTTAARLGQITGARVILGSATPALNELFLAHEQRINHVRLTKRANDIPLPQGIIIDLRDKELLRVSKFIAQPLVDAIEQTLSEGRQSLLYLNRRGSASSQVCGDCGHVTICPHCLLPLTFHADLMRLICHHCNFRQANPAVCPECNGANLKLLGGGTKRIEAEVERLWPDARIARLDRDSATLSHIKAVYRGLRDGSIDIVIGTQMIAKGLDLPAIDTVGIVSADTMLHLPDYTAAERTFSLLSQVSGRAGRGDRAGRIFIQTYTPDHPAIVAASTGDFDGFAAAELVQRQALAYPPYRYLAKLTVTAKSREDAMKQAADLAANLRRQPGLTITGPAPAFIEVQGQRYTWIITVKSTHRAQLVALSPSLPANWTLDLDPINLL